MVPKVEAASKPCRRGCKKVHIVDGRMPHSLLLEIYSDRGIGTEIVRAGAALQAARRSVPPDGQTATANEGP